MPDSSQLLSWLVWGGLLALVLGVVMLAQFIQGQAEARKLAEGAITLDHEGREYRVSFAVAGDGPIVATVERHTATGWEALGQQSIPFHPDGVGPARNPRGSYDLATRRQMAEQAVRDTLAPPPYPRYVI